MPVEFNSNLEYQGKLGNFARDNFETIEDMQNYPSTSLDEGHIAYCQEAMNHYIWSASFAYSYATYLGYVSSDSGGGWGLFSLVSGASGISDFTFNELNFTYFLNITDTLGNIYTAYISTASRIKTGLLDSNTYSSLYDGLKAVEQSLSGAAIADFYYDESYHGLYITDSGNKFGAQLSYVSSIYPGILSNTAYSYLWNTIYYPKFVNYSYDFGYKVSLTYNYGISDKLSGVINTYIPIVSSSSSGLISSSSYDGLMSKIANPILSFDEISGGNLYLFYSYNLDNLSINYTYIQIPEAQSNKYGIFSPRTYTYFTYKVANTSLNYDSSSNKITLSYSYGGNNATKTSSSITIPIVSESNDGLFSSSDYSNMLSIYNGLNEYLLGYGIEFDTSSSSPTCVRIGNLDLHKSLPIQSKIKGCLISRTTGEVIEYLGDDWNTVLDNYSSSIDGGSAHVMVEIPAHYRKCVADGTVRQVWISEYPLPGFVYIPKSYVGAYEASTYNSSYLCSSNNKIPKGGLSREQYRVLAQNNNQSGKYNWNIYTYQTHKTLYWLFSIEYATFNSQLDFTTELTSDGYHQGGLGIGATYIPSSYIWEKLYSYSPIIETGVTNGGNDDSYVYTYKLPFRYDIMKNLGENEYGYVMSEVCDDYCSTYNIGTKYAASNDNSGDLTTYIFNGYYFNNNDYLYITSISNLSTGAIAFEYDSLSSIYGITEYNFYTNPVAYASTINRTSIPVNRYRGIENIFGHLNKWVDGISISSGDFNTTSGLGTVTFCDIPQFFYQGDTTYINTNIVPNTISTYKNFSYIGTYFYTFCGNNSYCIHVTTGFEKTHAFGSYGEIYANSLGGSTSTYLCDYQDNQTASTECLAGLLVGGNLMSSYYGGLGATLIRTISTDGNLYSYSAYWGSRLTYILDFPSTYKNMYF